MTLTPKRPKDAPVLHTEFTLEGWTMHAQNLAEYLSEAHR